MWISLDFDVARKTHDPQGGALTTDIPRIWIVFLDIAQAYGQALTIQPSHRDQTNLFSKAFSYLVEVVNRRLQEKYCDNLKSLISSFLYFFNTQLSNLELLTFLFAMILIQWDIST